MEKVHEVTIYKFLRSENVVVDVLSNLAKELKCLTNESIFIDLHNQNNLQLVSIEFIKSKTLKEEIETSKDDLIVN